MGNSATFSKRIYPSGKSKFVCSCGGVCCNHLVVRDSLRKSEELREEYQRIKLKLSEAASSLDDYCHGKTDFIIQILRREGSKHFAEHELNEICAANL